MNRYLAAGIGMGVTSVLFVLALPLGEQGFIGSFALVPLLIATRRQGFLFGFVTAMISLFLTALIAASGIFYSQKMPHPEGTAMVYAACGIFGFACALTIAFAADPKLGEKPVWALAGLATLLEAALLIEIPGHLALTQYRNGSMLAIASVGGIWLVSFLLYWINLAVSRLDRDKWWLGLAPVALVYASGFIPGPSSIGTIPVAVIQNSLDAPDDFERLHAEAASREVELVVWPEFAGAGLVGKDTQKLKSLSLKAPLVTSFPDTHRPKPHNVAALFMDGKESPRYKKRKLFGGEKQQHTPGKESVVVPFGSKKLGLGICFDSCFPSSMRATGRGADVIALPTADPLSPHGFLAAVHAAYTPFRAAETGVPIIRADTDAFSMVVDSAGTIISEAGIGSALLVAQMPTRFRDPLAMYVGDGMLLVSAFLLVFGFYPRRPVDSKPKTG
jgi:apolipoprotein N-acyltransferase